MSRRFEQEFPLATAFGVVVGGLFLGEVDDEFAFGFGMGEVLIRLYIQVVVIVLIVVGVMVLMVFLNLNRNDLELFLEDLGLLRNLLAFLVDVVFSLTQ